MGQRQYVFRWDEVVTFQNETTFTVIRNPKPNELGPILKRVFGQPNEHYL